MWIKRKCQSTLKSLCEMFPAVVVTGARQAGKTALVQKVFPDFAYDSLDLPSLAAQAEHSPQAFLKAHGAPLILDEVQYAPALFRHLKAAIDAEKKQLNITEEVPFARVADFGPLYEVLAEMGITPAPDSAR